ncbi:hypothetical protein OUY_05300 [Wolbachia endosymbiont of Leptopilina clavipes]|uniref:hypothetical protein n=1 Tax=Wolbachia endosymbiont of Leptopilina clavipes TaxID=260213 RepID=UPI00111AFE44|nr:hypothetical protein [Wolbachia endosymbiont of Leptopilina clavipes]TNK93569.1 hypothetical protein OUY_05300 [Wolbachia endosymbiont of Leptopilina clavipes]
MNKIEAIKDKYRDEGLLSAAKEVPVQGRDLVKENYKTTVTFAEIALVTSLIAAYFLSPAYATFVGTVGTKAETLVNPAITAMSKFAFAHPLVASLVVLAAVAALITAPVYVYMNSSKAGQIEKVKQGIRNACEKESNNYKFDGSELKFSNDENVRTTFFDTVVSAVGGAKSIL